jgi:hypothetical protein
MYGVIHKSLRDSRPMRYSSRDGHAEGKHVNRGRDTPRFCPTLQVLDSSFLLCLSWLLHGRVRKFRKDLRITLYFAIYIPILLIFTTCGFLQSVYQPKNTINKRVYNSSIKLLHVSTLGYHLQGAF